MIKFPEESGKLLEKNGEDKASSCYEIRYQFDEMLYLFRFNI